MGDLLLDCNHLSAAIRKISIVRERIHQVRKSGSRFITCVPVLCELEAGIQQTAKPNDYRRRLRHLLRDIRQWSLDEEAARFYGAIYGELRRQGRVLSQVDMMLAAMARQYKLVLLTTDQGFKALPDIRTDNWV